MKKMFKWSLTYVILGNVTGGSLHVKVDNFLKHHALKDAVHI